MPRVIHFEFPVDDPDRAVDFYKNVFGWEINKWDGPEDYWMITSGSEEEPGIDGALMRRRDPGQGPINTVGIPSVDDFVAKITASGGQVVMPKMAIPSIGYFAYCSDTEGNVFGIMESDPSAQ
jgi:predicted enzyme related to lactoylglutathione lyase